MPQPVPPPLPASRAFAQIDVFTAVPYYGNPLAVVLDAQGLDDATMQRFAAWLNLSETTFMLPPTPTGAAAGADYRVRIFTPQMELPFAGHPTLGSCHAWLEAGGQPRAGQLVVQECRQGLITIRREAPSVRVGPQTAGATLAFRAPPLVRSAPAPSVVSQAARALGLEPQHIVAAQMLDNGPLWLGLLLDSAQAVRRLQPQHAMLRDLGIKVGVVHASAARASAKGATAEPYDAQREAPSVVVRAFAAAMGIDEDPVTGSLNASLAQWLMADGRAPERYVVIQGEALGRAGRVHVSRDAAGDVWVGGACVTSVRGQVGL